ncbi:MAG: SBBP repeat-containing protein [Ignavibacteria bacterium]|nr:SBBP repeat-containing protein [Ignavibacteria bacterium]
MKKIYIRIFAVVFILFTNSASDLSAQWDTLSTGVNTSLHAVQFINTNTGWIAGSNGKIKKSTNGGNSWFNQSINSSENLRRIFMIDANTGFICGDSGKILKTTNGGNDWNNTNTSGFTENIYAMDFINASTGICANESRRQFKTTNGGVNWISSNMIGVSTLLSIYGIDMTDSNTVYVSTSSGYLTSAKVYKSVNFGTSYIQSLNDASNFLSANIKDVKFINTSTGYAGASNNNLARTTNGGTAWTVKSFPRAINQISFPDTETGYICGEDFFKAKTDDDGDNWAIDYNYNNGEGLFGIYFINSSTGWMCGSGGLLIKTTNGGGIPASCNITNSSWVNMYENSSASNESVVDDCGNIYITGYTNTSNSKDILTQKYSSSGYLYWSKTYNGSGDGNDEGIQIKLDDDGNVFVAGHTTGSTTGSDFVLIKYLSDGQREWVRTFDYLNDDEYSVDLAIDNSGNAIILGNNEYPDPESQFPFSLVKVLKYNTDGELQWNHELGVFNSYYNSLGIVCNNSNDIFIIALHDEFQNKVGIFYKFNSSGIVQWSRSYNSTYLKSIAIGIDGNVYVSGSVGNQNTNSRDLLTCKYNNAGTELWSRYLDGGLSINDYPVSMSVSNEGQVVITGYLNDGKPFTLKYNTLGYLQWYQRYENPGYFYNPEDIAIEASGNIYVTGYRDAFSLFFRPDIFTMKYNSTGTSLNVIIYGDSLKFESGNSISVDISGNVFVTGQSQSNPNYLSTILKYSPSDFSDNKTLNLTALIQGFYNSSSDLMVQDTVRVYLRSSASPYAIVDSAVSILSNTGAGAFIFSNAVNSTNYYIAVKHRNSIETWSNTAQQFTSNSMTYDFTTANTQAYGDNMMQADSSPLRFAIFSGDVNQDGTVDATDVSNIDNDASNFVSGYVASDLTGDDFVDGTDFAIADNNAANFVSVAKP